MNETYDSLKQVTLWAGKGKSKQILKRSIHIEDILINKYYSQGDHFTTYTRIKQSSVQIHFWTQYYASLYYPAHSSLLYHELLFDCCFDTLHHYFLYAPTDTRGWLSNGVDMFEFRNKYLWIKPHIWVLFITHHGGSLWTKIPSPVGDNFFMLWWYYGC